MHFQNESDMGSAQCISHPYHSADLQESHEYRTVRTGGLDLRRASSLNVSAYHNGL